MAASTTSQVYIDVIEDVMVKVRDEFINNGGPGEEILKELQATWESKMMHAGVILGPIERSTAAKPTPGGPITPVHDLNVPYEGTEEYETPTAEILFPPTPLQTPIQTPLPGTTDNSMYNIPTGPSDYSSGNDTGGNSNTDVKGGRHGPYVQPPSPWMNKRPSLDVNVAYVEGRDEADRGTFNQPLTQDFLAMSSGKRKRDDSASQYNAGGYIPQQDGSGDAASRVFELEIYNYGGVFSEDYNIANTPAPPEVPASTPALVAQNEVGDDDDDDEPPLNENDDDDLDDVDQGEDQNTHHLVLAQFDKVTRSKSRWKCTLKDGIMRINNKDILFNKATGEFDF